MTSSPKRSHHHSHTSAAILGSNVTWQGKMKEMRKSLTKTCLKENFSHILRIPAGKTSLEWMGSTSTEEALVGFAGL